MPWVMPWIEALPQLNCCQLGNVQIDKNDVVGVCKKRIENLNIKIDSWKGPKNIKPQNYLSESYVSIGLKVEQMQHEIVYLVGNMDPVHSYIVTAILCYMFPLKCKLYDTNSTKVRSSDISS